MKEEIVVTQVWIVGKSEDDSIINPDEGEPVTNRTIIRLKDVIDYEECSYGPLSDLGSPITEVHCPYSTKYVKVSFNKFNEFMMAYWENQRKTKGILWSKN